MDVGEANEGGPSPANDGSLWGIARRVFSFSEVTSESTRANWPSSDGRATRTRAKPSSVTGVAGLSYVADPRSFSSDNVADAGGTSATPELPAGSSDLSLFHQKATAQQPTSATAIAMTIFPPKRSLSMPDILVSPSNLSHWPTKSASRSESPNVPSITPSSPPATGPTGSGDSPALRVVSAVSVCRSKPSMSHDP